ncbi:hypothetical protein EW146_g9502, partial [Bondarzewia mesenterica]
MKRTSVCYPSILFVIFCLSGCQHTVHASRDQILLDGGGYGEGDEEEGEEEVFALKGMPDSDDSEEEDMTNEDEDIEDEGGKVEELAEKQKVKAKTKGKTRPQQVPDASDESEDEEEEEGWGDKKSAYYSTNAAELDSEDEEANELEEQ